MRLVRIAEMISVTYLFVACFLKVSSDDLLTFQTSGVVDPGVVWLARA